MNKLSTRLGALGTNQATVRNGRVCMMADEEALRLAREVMASHAETLRKLASTPPP